MSSSETNRPLQISETDREASGILGFIHATENRHVTQGDLDRLAKELECWVAREEYNEAGQPVYVIYRIEEVSKNGNGKEQTCEEELGARGDQSGA